MSHTIKRIPLNGARLRAARQKQELGTRQLARAAGTTFVLIDSIEKENFIGSGTTLAEFRALARSAGLTMTDLLDETDADDDSAAEPSDVQRLAGVLITEPRMQSNDDIASALGWPLTRLHAAAHALNAALIPLGLRVHSNPGQMCLRPAATSSIEDAKEVSRRRAGREGITATEARLLYQALKGTLPDKVGAGVRTSLGHLINLGYLAPGRRTEPNHVITDDARFAFDIDAEDPQGDQ